MSHSSEHAPPLSSLSLALLVAFCALCNAQQTQTTAGPSEGSGENGASSLVVATAYGKLEGFSLPTGANDSTRATARLFLGVPFAAPPVGELRLEKPVPPQSWEDVRPAKEFALACWPLSRTLMGTAYNYSEDCLYLNVMAPAWKSEESNGFPVLVFIHGGAYAFGSAMDFGYDFFVRNYVPENLIVVTVQYRLGHFGFAASDNASFAGNYGLWDHQAALQYVHDNIAQFGGDPSRVTIWGHSAGSCSVSHLTLSPHTYNLFSQAIQLSGSAFAAWGEGKEVTDVTATLSAALHCTQRGGNVVAEKECIKSKSVKQMLDAIDVISPARLEMNFLKFGPRFDGDFVPDQLSELVKSAPKKPNLMGVTELESSAITLVGLLKQLTYAYVPKWEYPLYSDPLLRVLLLAAVARVQDFGVKALSVVDAIADHYESPEASTEDGERDYTFYLKQFNRILTDGLFVVPAVLEAENKANADWPVYLYRQSYFNEAHFPATLPVKKAMHCNEYPYLFGISFLNPPAELVFDATDVEYSADFVAAIVSFTKTGTPVIPSLAARGESWPRVAHTNTRNESFPHVLLNATRSVETDAAYFSQTLAFWRALAEEYGYDIVRQMSAPLAYAN